jgi:hypothetical protein
MRGFRHEKGHVFTVFKPGLQIRIRIILGMSEKLDPGQHSGALEAQN